ncbi:NADH(P)-binding family protein (plasmid) [Ochrobactrum quorumnocens]|uniref:NADH(P)-binding family protein n=1 Tax=Ochrobactrum quorumnocens TaxID=271865 RepID=A0A248UNH8_9HYPH|nr:SDR family oxidoreductase [[Ochrobactrum] quorumnocens]ASV87951.1 NADH(P)-binding family protein [[Ochrobactrum] quorumnocens]
MNDKRQTALLLGGSKGLGLGVAEALAKKGVDIALVGRDKIALRAAEERLGTRAGSVTSFTCDLTDPGSVSKMMENVDKAVGSIDILLLNGGGPAPVAASQYDETYWNTQIRSMFLSQIEVTAHYLPAMRAHHFGRIIAVSSTSIREPIPNLAASNAVRSALAGWAKTLASEVAEDGVTVNVVMPGRFATDRTTRLDALDAAERGVDTEVIAAESQREIPAGRYGTAEEFGEVVAFLASKAASYVNGVALPIDGGLCRSMI